MDSCASVRLSRPPKVVTWLSRGMGILQPAAAVATVDEEDASPEMQQCLTSLREGKRCAPASALLSTLCGFCWLCIDMCAVASAIGMAKAAFLWGGRCTPGHVHSIRSCRLHSCSPLSTLTSWCRALMHMGSLLKLMTCRTPPQRTTFHLSVPDRP